ncbi:MAG: hypothetical protein QME94_12395, partial [Anaerolineae bacterium]|nr:hypothetical protein [Anaerolineae bacterium]
RHAPGAILCASAAVLSHPAMAWAAAVGVALLFLAHARSRRGLVQSLVVAAGTAAMTAPWWATVIARHGLAPLIAAGGSPEPAFTGLASLLQLTLTDEPYFPLLGGLAVVGAVASAGRRECLLPAWVAALFVLDPRTARTTAAVPVALLAGMGLQAALAMAPASEGKARGNAVNGRPGRAPSPLRPAPSPAPPAGRGARSGQRSSASWCSTPSYRR